MAEILGLGVTHWPTLCLPNEGLTGVFKRTLDAPNVDPARKDPIQEKRMENLAGRKCPSCSNPRGEKKIEGSRATLYLTRRGSSRQRSPDSRSG